MAKSLTSQHVVLHGEVIEIIEGEGKKTIKINLTPCTIDLPLSKLDEPHLGELVTVEAILNIKSVEPAAFVD